MRWFASRSGDRAGPTLTLRSLFAVLVVAVAIGACGADVDTGDYEARIASLEDDLADAEAELAATRTEPQAPAGVTEDQASWCHEHVDQLLWAAESMQLRNQPGPRILEWVYKEVRGVLGGTLTIKDGLVETQEWTGAWNTWTAEHPNEWTLACLGAAPGRWSRILPHG